MAFSDCNTHRNNRQYNNNPNSNTNQHEEPGKQFHDRPGDH